MTGARPVAIDAGLDGADPLRPAAPRLRSTRDNGGQC
jgi:hypothetical protein